MLLIDAADVKAVYETSRDATAIAPFLTVTEAFTKRLIGKGLSNDVFKEVQRYYTAHLLFVTDTGVHEALRVEDVSETFTKSKRGGLLNSRWGEMAIALDITGTLASANALQPLAQLRLIGSTADDSSSSASTSDAAIQTINGSSIVETSGAGTSYILNGVGSTESFWSVPSLTGVKLRVNRSAAPGVGCSITYTVRRNGEDTDIVLTLDADDVSGESADALTAAFIDGDRISIKEDRDGDVADGSMDWTFEYLPA